MKSKRRASIRCLLVDDHAIMREGLRSLLEREPGFEVVGDAGDGRKAIKLARQLSPDIVVMDVSMPDVNGIEATRTICAAPIAPKILCLSMHAERGLITAMLQAGASGYLLKSGAARELVEALRVVMSGNTYLSPSIAADVVADHARQGRGSTRGGVQLTSRERQVLEMIAEGCHTKEIASRLNIGIKTVFTHRERMMRKLRVESNVGLVKYAMREGLTSV